MDTYDNTASYLAATSFANNYYSGYSYTPSNSLIHYSYPVDQSIRSDDSVIYLFNNDSLARDLGHLSISGDPCGPLIDPSNGIVDSSPYQVMEPSFSSDLLASELVPLEVDHGYGSYNGYAGLHHDMPEEKPSFLSLENYESNLPADLSNYNSIASNSLGYPLNDTNSECTPFCSELYPPEVMPQEIEIKSEPLNSSAHVSLHRGSSDLVCGTGKCRQKKKPPVEYELLDINKQDEVKGEVIKYVGKGSYKCQICNKYSKNNKDYIQDHINIKHYGIKKNYQCMKCGITFAWRSGAFKHLKKYHHIEGKNTINYFRAISKRHMYISQRKRK